MDKNIKNGKKIVHVEQYSIFTTIPEWANFFSSFELHPHFFFFFWLTTSFLNETKLTKVFFFKKARAFFLTVKHELKLTKSQKIKHNGTKGTVRRAISKR